MHVVLVEALPLQQTMQFCFVFLAFDFCQFCVVIRFFHPRHNGQWLPTSKDFLSQILSITFLKKSYLNSSERAGISLLMLIAKQGNYWYHFYNVFGMTRSLTEGLNPGPPALEASTLPLCKEVLSIYCSDCNNCYWGGLYTSWIFKNSFTQLYLPHIFQFRGNTKQTLYVK